MCEALSDTCNVFWGPIVDPDNIPTELEQDEKTGRFLTPYETSGDDAIVEEAGPGEQSKGRGKGKKEGEGGGKEFCQPALLALVLFKLSLLLLEMPPFEK